MIEGNLGLTKVGVNGIWHASLQENDRTIKKLGLYPSGEKDKKEKEKT